MQKVNPFTRDESKSIITALDIIRDLIIASSAKADADSDDPLAPTPFSTSGALERARGGMAGFSFSEAEYEEVLAKVDHAIEFQNRVQQGTERAVQVITTLRGLVPLLMGVAG